MQKCWDQMGLALWWRNTTASTTSSKFIAFSSKQGSRTTVLRGCDIVVIWTGGGEGTMITILYT
jgi:hypothetical protein